MLEVDAVEVEEVVSPGESLVSVSLASLLGASWLGMAVVVVGRVRWSEVVCWAAATDLQG